MSRKGENIYQRKDGRWEGRYIIGRRRDGKYRYGYEYADTYQEVRQKLILRKSEIIFVDGGNESSKRVPPAEKRAPLPGGPCLKELAEKWLDIVQYQVRESTYIKYWNLVHAYILPELGEMEWGKLDRESVERFCRQMLLFGGRKHRGLSAKTVSDVMSVLRHVFRHAAEHGAGMPFDISSVTVKKEMKDLRILSRNEQERLYRFLCADLSDRNLGILLCMFAGLRLGEICALCWEDISFAEQTVFVHQTMQRIQTGESTGKRTKIIITAPKSKSSVRRIPIPRELARLLFSCRKGRQGYILTGCADRYVEPRTMERHFEKVLKLAGLERVNFHVLRHTFATRCVEMDFDLKSLSELLGHANVNITLNRYVHPSMELKRKNMQRLAELLTVSI